MELRKHSTGLKLLVASLLLLTTGCSLTQPKEVVVTRTVVQTPDIPLRQPPRPINMIDVNWYTVTTDNIHEFEERFENANGDLVFFALSVPHYENLSQNLADIRRYIEQQKAIIIYYEEQITAQTKNINNDTNSTDQE